MSEATFGQIFHTKDGKTVFIDPKTNQASVFEGVLTIEQIQEPTDKTVVSQMQDEKEVLAIMSQLLGGSLMPGFVSYPSKMDAFALKGLLQQSSEPVDILGPKDYYILAGKSSGPLAMHPCDVHAWTSELRQGHHPEYQGHLKHRIMPEQWDWLAQHPNCPIKAWYDSSCPAFVTLACQDHGKVIKPISKVDSSQASKTEPGVYAEQSSVQTHIETVLAEEREI
jgi:hypothetical protein